MSITVLFPLLFATPTQPTCAVQGTPLLEMREASTANASSLTTRIYRTGAWTSGTRRGCFDRAELRAIRLAVQRAPWQTVETRIACFAYDPKFTEFRVNGRLRFTEQLCSGKGADPSTDRAIELVKKELAEELPPPPPVSNAVLFEIHHGSDAAQPTSTLKLYSSGAWTFQPIDAAGHLGAMSTGHLDRTTLASLRQSINAAPWDTSISGLTCKAYSPNFTEYFVRGKLEYTARLCGRERLDDASLAVIKKIEAQLQSPEPAKPAHDC